MGFFTKAVGWAVAHKDAFFTAFNIFRALRGRRKATQESGQSFRDYYIKEGDKVLRGASPVKTYAPGRAPVRIYGVNPPESQ